MNLYLLRQDENNNYDSFDSAIIAAESEEEAKLFHPSGSRWDQESPEWDSGKPDNWKYEWASSPDNVEVLLIGTAVEGTKAGVILASYNAG